MDGLADEAVLCVKGRLLKDLARLSVGPEQRRLYGNAAAAYGEAGAISWATYPLINAASLSLLAGEPDRAAALAERVLERLASGEEEPDTPFWGEATAAEALLLLGRTEEAKARLGAAIALAPGAWEDRAVTLRQFEMILAARGEPTDWLDGLRPPRSLHYAGRLALEPGDPGLEQAIARVLEAEDVSFGFGALAAGADILVAEALVARGAELHVVLPAPLAAFRAVSVAPFGAQWERRLEALLPRAASISVTDPQATAPTAAGLALADATAMGRAAMQANLLASQAVRLRVGEPGGEDWSGGLWRRAGRREVILPATPGATPAGSELAEPPAEGLAAVLAVEPGEGGLAGLDAALAGLETVATPAWTGEGMLLAFAEPAEAARAAESLAAAGAGRLAGTFGVCRTGEVLGSRVIEGEAAGAAGRLLALTPPGGALVTLTFAAALAAGAEGPRCEPAGDLAREDDLDRAWDPALFSLRLARPQPVDF